VCGTHNPEREGGGERYHGWEVRFHFFLHGIPFAYWVRGSDRMIRSHMEGLQGGIASHFHGVFLGRNGWVGQRRVPGGLGTYDELRSNDISL
jgi:hypothetical protein